MVSPYEIVKRLAKFVLVGLLGTGIYYAILCSLVELSGIPVLIATSIAFILVCLENYILHYVWTFNVTGLHAFSFPRFMFMNFIGFWLNWGIMFFGLKMFSINYLLVQAVAIITVVSWNFTLCSLWIFRDRQTIQSTRGIIVMISSQLKK